MAHQKQRILLRKWRDFRGLTQERLAERAGVSQGLISQLENNKTDFTGDVLAALAYALGCDPADLLMRDPTDPDALWSIHDALKKATPQERDQVKRVADALLQKAS